MTSSQSPIFARCQDLLAWLIPLTLKFPRQQRFVLAQAVQSDALALRARLVEAAHAPKDQLGDALTRADVALDTLRFDLRLCHDLHLLDGGQYEHVAKALAEIGRLLGGWRKASTARQTSAP